MATFKLGKLLMTMSIARKISQSMNFGRFVQASLDRYISNDWGVMDDSDKALNDEAVKSGDLRIRGAYICPVTKEKIWIITEADRSITTILLTSEY